MNTNSLRYFITVANEKNFTRAAQKLYISQPSLSQSIQTLEKQLGSILFDRSKPQLELTLAGDLYLEWAKQTLYSEAQISARILDLATKDITKFTVGTSPHRVLYILPPVIEKFYSVFPNCRISLEDRPTAELYKLIEDGVVDLVIDIPHPDEIKYTSVPLAEEQIMLAVPKSYQVSAGAEDGRPYGVIDLFQLRDFRFVLLHKDRMLGNISRNLCKQAGFLPDVYLECRNAETAHSMASRGVGVTFVHELNVKLKGPLPSLDYYYIKPLYPTSRLAAIYQKEQHITEAMRQFIEMLRNMLS